MKNIKTFESFNKNYVLLGYPFDNEKIEISQKEFDLINICTRFILQWKVLINSWTYRDDEKEDLKEWLNVYRITGDTDSMASDVKKYNM